MRETGKPPSWKGSPPQHEPEARPFDLAAPGGGLQFLHPGFLLRLVLGEPQEVKVLRSRIGLGAMRQRLESSEIPKGEEPDGILRGKALGEKPRVVLRIQTNWLGGTLRGRVSPGFRPRRSRGEPVPCREADPKARAGRKSGAKATEGHEGPPRRGPDRLATRSTPR